MTEALAVGRRVATRNRGSEEGFTLVELLVVLGIIALLAGLVAPQVLGYLGKARIDSARIQLRNLESALELYHLDVGNYPTSEQGLAALLAPPQGVVNWSGPYLRGKDGFSDPWGNPYLYKSPGAGAAFDLTSLGRDGRPGGEGQDGDISN